MLGPKRIFRPDLPRSAWNGAAEARKHDLGGAWSSSLCGAMSPPPCAAQFTGTAYGRSSLGSTCTAFTGRATGVVPWPAVGVLSLCRAPSVAHHRLHDIGDDGLLQLAELSHDCLGCPRQIKAQAFQQSAGVLELGQGEYHPGWLDNVGKLIGSLCLSCRQGILRYTPSFLVAFLLLLAEGSVLFGGHLLSLGKPSRERRRQLGRGLENVPGSLRESDQIVWSTNATSSSSASMHPGSCALRRHFPGWTSCKGRRHGSPGMLGSTKPGSSRTAL
jgi:hypothetical protein